MSTDMKGQTRQLARFAAGLDGKDLPEHIHVLFGDLLLDYLRVASIGAEMEWSRWADAYAESVAGKGGSYVLFQNRKINPVHATFLNATYVGSIDSDDTHVGSMLHPGSIVFSAALAVAQSHGASAQNLMAAVVAGYEAMIRIALAIQPTHFRRGFQSTATCGGFGAAVAAGRLLFRGSDSAERIADAIGLVASFSGGLTQFYHSGSTVKRIHAAHAAESGVSAALMVAKGFGGPQDILEGKDGFARAYADGFEPSLIGDGLGSTFRMEEVMVKGHACSARVQAAVEGMLGLRAEHGFAASDICSIRLGIPSVIAGRLTMPNPVDMQAAQMSLPFSVALAATMENPLPTSTLSVRDFARGLTEPLGALQDRMRIEVDDEVERTSTDKSVSAKLHVELASGKVVEIFVPAPKGSASRPYSSVDHIERFKAELSPRIGAQATDAVVAVSRAPDTLDAVWLGEILAAGSAPRMVAAR